MSGTTISDFLWNPGTTFVAGACVGFGFNWILSNIKHRQAMSRDDRNAFNAAAREFRAFALHMLDVIKSNDTRGATRPGEYLGEPVPSPQRKHAIAFRSAIAQHIGEPTAAAFWEEWSNYCRLVAENSAGVDDITACWQRLIDFADPR